MIGNSRNPTNSCKFNFKGGIILVADITNRKGVKNMSIKVLNTSVKQRFSIKTQIIAALAAAVAAVVLPQIFHLIGAASGLGTALGEAFLPMHLPIILVGLLAGPVAGAAAGAISPAVSFLLTEMPSASMLPFMIIELCTYGFAAGLLKNVKMPSFLKVLAVQLAGRIIKAAAILVSIYALKNDSVSAEMIISSIRIGLFGLVLQWTFIPLIIYRVESNKKNEK